MSHQRLVSSRSVKRPELPVKPSDHPSVSAFEVEFEYLIRTLRRLGGSRNDVEDLAHEVFLVLYQNWERYDASRPLRAYLFGIAFRVTNNYLRKRKRELLLAAMEVGDLGPQSDHAIEASQARALVFHALKRVSLQRRAVLIMHDIDKLPMAEIAANLSINRFTGYSRLRKARTEFAEAVNLLLGVDPISRSLKGARMFGNSEPSS